MNHLGNTFPLLSILHEETKAIIVNDDLTVSFENRKGQFSFETKDIFVMVVFMGVLITS